MITKAKGVKDNCPSCGLELICNEKDYKGAISLQWQDPSSNTAHFNFDFATKKSSCKASVGGQTTTATTFAPRDELNISELSRAKKDQDAIMTATEDGTERMLVVLSGVQRLGKLAGISHPATIGMVFNQVCESRR